jgi:hypothetical protein
VNAFNQLSSCRFHGKRPKIETEDRGLIPRIDTEVVEGQDRE